MASISSKNGSTSAMSCAACDRVVGLRAAADRLGISPAYLSRIERGRERPPKPELVKRLATLLGGDPDLLFRLAESTDPDLAAYIHDVPRVPEFLRTAKEMNLTSEDFEVLIEEVRRRRPSEVADTAETSARARCDADFGLCRRP